MACEGALIPRSSHCVLRFFASLSISFLYYPLLFQDSPHSRLSLPSSPSYHRFISLLSSYYSIPLYADSSLLPSIGGGDNRDFDLDVPLMTTGQQALLNH